MRIAKFIASSGLCSRRGAENLILQRRVEVDGKLLTSPAVNISADNIIKVDDKIIDFIPEPRLWLYYKPLGLITTHNDPQGRPTIFDQLEQLPRVVSIGRLDINSEGLLLLTNNGELSRYFEMPKNRIVREYKARAYGQGADINIDNTELNIDGINYRPKLIKLVSKKGSNAWYKIVLMEGKNREIRKIFQYFGFKVSRLIRIKYGIYDLGNMNPGEYKEVKVNENYRWKV